MKVCFFVAEKSRENRIAGAFLEGVRKGGGYPQIRTKTEEGKVADGCDVAVMFGVKSRATFDANRAAGIPVIMVDKGYLRRRMSDMAYWRVAVNAHHPTRYLMETKRPFDRLGRLNVSPLKWRKRGHHIVIAGSSAKYHDFYGLPEPTEYTRNLVAEIRKRSNLPIIYRPKPSWRKAVPIEGTKFSGGKQSIQDVLHGAHVLVTHGSNSCFEAILSGVPCIVLGDAIAKPVSSRYVDDVKNPFIPSSELRRQWLANLAYCQWTTDEFESGEAWKVIREQLDHANAEADRKREP